MVMRDVILDKRDALDPNCHARVKFCAQCIAEDCPAKNIVRFLTKLSTDMVSPSDVGALPRLLVALPAKKRLAVLMAGFWLDDVEEVVNVAIDMCGFECACAARQTIGWFRTASPVTYLATIGA